MWNTGSLWIRVLLSAWFFQVTKYVSVVIFSLASFAGNVRTYTAYENRDSFPIISLLFISNLSCLLMQLKNKLHVHGNIHLNVQFIDRYFIVFLFTHFQRIASVYWTSSHFLQIVIGNLSEQYNLQGGNEVQLCHSIVKLSWMRFRANTDVCKSHM